MQSANGWPAGSRAVARIGSFRVPGTDVVLAVNRDAAPLLIWAAREWNRTVEPLRKGWCWGYADRPVRGYSVPSFHASGTAIDLNAPLHPLGVADTLTPKQLAAVDAIVRRSKGTLRAGCRYQRRVDAMHLEVVGTRAEAIAIGKALTAQPARLVAATLGDGGPRGPWPLPATHVLGPDGHGRVSWHDGTEDRTSYYAVRAVQREVGVKVDGHYGASTVEAVKRWQHATGFASQSGFVNPTLWAAMTRR